MKAAISRRHCALLLGSAGLSTLGGCSSIFSHKPVAAGIAAAALPRETGETIRINYRTRTDRLNLAGSHLPHCSIAALHVETPVQPVGGTACPAIVRITPCSAAATPFPERGVTASISALWQDESPPAAASSTCVWSTSVELWEVQAIVASLEKLNFFHKYRTVLSADVFLSVETDRHAVGKKYRPVAELDALVLRVAQPGNLAGAGPSSAISTAPVFTARAELVRLPALE